MGGIGWDWVGLGADGLHDKVTVLPRARRKPGWQITAIRTIMHA